MSFESIQTELHFIEAEQLTLLTADSRGTDHISWSHSPECTLTPTGRCSCSKGIFTSEHFGAFESQLAQNTNVTSNPVQVNIKDKEAITFFSRFIGTVKGLKPDLINVRNDRDGGGGPDFLSTVTAACTTKDIHGRAVWADSGCFSNTFRRCFALIKKQGDMLHKLTAPARNWLRDHPGDVGAPPPAGGAALPAPGGAAVRAAGKSQATLAGKFDGPFLGLKNLPRPDVTFFVIGSTSR
jgi:hypothetical protein